MPYKNKKSKINILILLFIIIELFNILFAESVANIIITIPQAIFVLFLIFNGKLEKACYFNILFTVLCFNTDFGLTSNETILSYAKIKVFGPFTLSYMLGGVIWVATVNKYTIIAPADSLFFKFYKTIKYLLVSGGLIGFMGVILWAYPLEYFIRPLVYIVNAYIYTDILLRFYSQDIVKKYQRTAFCLLVASPIATSLSFFLFQVRGSYSVFEALITNEVYTYVPCLLIILLLGTKYKVQALVALFCYFLNLLAAARGAYYMTTAIAIVFCIYIIYFSKNSFSPRLSIAYKIVFPVIAIGISVYGFINMSSEGMASQKLAQFLSLGNLFFQSGDYDFSPETVSSSPFIRVGELVNIVYEGSYNPIGLLVGKGYGGYYIDDLRLFSMLDLSQGAFADDIAASGKFRTAHSMLPSSILYNGLIGALLLIRLGIEYLKRITISPFVYVAATLFFYSFYYDPLLIIVSILILFGAEYDLRFKNLQ